MFKSSPVSPISARKSQTRISRTQNRVFTLEVSATFVRVHIKSESGNLTPSFLFLPLWSNSLATVTGFVVHIYIYIYI